MLIILLSGADLLVVIGGCNVVDPHEAAANSVGPGSIRLPQRATSDRHVLHPHGRS